jgi:hypothetical protein
MSELKVNVTPVEDVMWSEVLGIGRRKYGIEPLQ